MSESGRSASSRARLGGFGILGGMVLLCWSAGAQAHVPHACSPDMPETPVLAEHLEQRRIDAGEIGFEELFAHGRALFVGKFNLCDGQGRPAATGIGEKRVPDEPAFIRTSGPDANACSGCHIEPRVGGAGDFIVNAFVLAQARDPVTTSVRCEFSNERNTLGMFGAGAIEMLAREMTADLRLPSDPEAAAEISRGERRFADIGCTGCHRPALRLEGRRFVEPYALNPPGFFRDTDRAVSFDMTREGEGPYLEPTPEGGAIVRAYTDLKRHHLCDPPGMEGAIRHFCNEYLDQGRPDQGELPGKEFFITRKLWDVGNSAPYGHRGDLTTLTGAIRAHGGEGRESLDAFAALPLEDREAIIAFLKSLQVLPAGSPRIRVEP